MLYNGIVNKFARVCGVIFMVCMLLASNGMRVSAQEDTTSQYFPSTGHNISGAFWTYYQHIPNAAYVFGAPITEQFTDIQSGRIIQYFQRARFEYYPENPIEQRVKLSAVGQHVFQHSKVEGKLDIFTPIGCRSYADTGFSLCYAFLEFFDANGGEDIFGKPVSPFVFYNGRIVQYFERARFDWFPENPDGEKVVLAEVGRIYFDIVPEDANRLQPVRAENTPGDVRALFPKAFTWKAVTGLDDTQAVYVVVQDQTFTPVVDATAIITITWPKGETQRMAKTTNALGVVAVPFQVLDQPHGGMVLIDVEVQYMGLTKKTQTSFRVW
jgi:hypothetical protein